MSEVATIQNEVQFETVNDFIDMVEYVMINEMVEGGEFELIQAPIEHTFTKGLYTRKITMPAQSRFTSVTHKFEHPYFVLTGKVSVYSENDGGMLIIAPYQGITKPGTRRVLHVHEETVWITTHVTDIQPENDSEEAKDKAAELVMLQITEPHRNKLFNGSYRNSVFTPDINEINNEQ